MVVEIGQTSSHAWARGVVPAIADERRTTVLRGGATVVAYLSPGAPDDALHVAADEAVFRGSPLTLVERMGGDIAAYLVAVSRTADLLVVGIPGPVSGANLLSPLTRTLAHRAYCPVMFVPPGAALSGFSEVVCGIDRSTGSAAALKWAAREAGIRGVTVLAQQVQPWGGTQRGIHADEPAQPLSRWVFAQSIAEQTTIVCRLVDGSSAASVLVETTAERQALLVVGSHRVADSESHRCVTRRIAGQVTVPVVVVPPEIPAPRTPPGT